MSLVNQRHENDYLRGQHQCNGTFLTFSLFNSKESAAIEEKLREYTSSVHGGLEAADIKQDDPNFCAILLRDSKAIITYPDYFTGYLESSARLSELLQIPLYTFNIYDGDYWMLYCFDNGALRARFNPLPGYWTKKADREQVKTWNFDVKRLCDDFNVSATSVDSYFIDWKNTPKQTKAYKDDEFYYGDCFQVFDLLRHFQISYGDVTNAEGQARTFKLWTSYFARQEVPAVTFEAIRKTKRYTTNYLRLSPDDIETILGINYDWFVHRLTKNQWCQKCNIRDTEREDFDCFLSINELMIKVTGHCRNCGKRMDGGYGITNLVKLKEVLER